MKMSLILAALVGLTLFGCGSYLRKDPSVASIEAGYPTAELSGCGKRSVGLLLCGAQAGQDLAGLKLAVHGLFEGTIRVVSVECGVDATFRYEGNEDVDLGIKGPATKDCVYSVTITPEFPGEEDGGISIHGSRGHVAVRVVEQGENWFGVEKKIVQGGAGLQAILLPGVLGQFEQQTAGCGKRSKFPVTLVDSFVLDYKDVNDSSKVQVCMVEGVLRGQPTMYFNAFVANYAKDYVPLPIPLVNWDGNTLHVTGDKAVSAIEVNGEGKKGYKNKFKVKTSPVLVRLYTVKGRMVLGEWNDEEGVWTWRN